MLFKSAFEIDAYQLRGTMTGGGYMRESLTKRAAAELGVKINEALKLFVLDIENSTDPETLPQTPMFSDIEKRPVERYEARIVVIKESEFDAFIEVVKKLFTEHFVVAPARDALKELILNLKYK